MTGICSGFNTSKSPSLTLIHRFSSDRSFLMLVVLIIPSKSSFIVIKNGYPSSIFASRCSYLYSSDEDDESGPTSWSTTCSGADCSRSDHSASFIHSDEYSTSMGSSIRHNFLRVGVAIIMDHLLSLRYSTVPTIVLGFLRSLLL